MGSLTTQLNHVERWTLVLAAGVVAVGLVALPRHLALSASVGAGFMCLNAFAIRKLSERTLSSEASAQRPGAAILLFNLKMFALLAAIVIAVRGLHLDGIGVLIGVSVFPVAVVIAAVRATGTDDDGATDPPTPSNPIRRHQPTQGDR